MIWTVDVSEFSLPHKRINSLKKNIGLSMPFVITKLYFIRFYLRISLYQQSYVRFRLIISFTNIVFILSMTLAIGYFLTRRSHAIICCYNESSSMYCLRDDGTRNNSKSSWWGKTKMSIALRKLFSSLMLQLLLQFKEVQINEATFS